MKLVNKIKELFDKSSIEEKSSKALDGAKDMAFAKYNISSDGTAVQLVFHDPTKVGGKRVVVNFYSVKEIVID